MIRRSSYNILRVIIAVLVFYYCCKKLQQTCSATKSCLTLCDPTGCSMPGSSVLHYLQVCSNSYPLSWWCYLTISTSGTLFSSCLQSFPASGSFPMSQLLASGGQIIGASAGTNTLNIQYSSLNIQG